VTAQISSAQWAEQVKKQLMVQSAPTLLGSVTVDEAVLGATIRVFDKQGNLLYEQENATEGFEGRFEIPSEATRPFPMDFRVVATGGTHRGEPFQGELVCDGLKWPVEILGLNPVTTLIARYRDHHPDIPLAEAQERVRRYLMIPAEEELVGHLKPYFSGEEFLRQAADMGGPNAFIDTLVLAIDDPNVPWVPPLGPPGPGGTLGPLKSFMGSLADDLVAELIGWAFGELMTSIFGEEADIVSQKLDQIINLLQALSNQVDQLGRDLKVEIGAAELGESLARISTLFKKYGHVAALKPESLTEAEKADREMIIQDIKRIALEYLETDITRIRNRLLGNATLGVSSLLDNWTDKVIRETADKGLYGPILKTSSYYDEQGPSALQQYQKIEAVFLHLVAAQIHATTILEEVYNMDNRTISLNWLRSYFRECIEEETELFTQCVEKFVLGSPWWYWIDTEIIWKTKSPTAYNWNSLIESEFCGVSSTQAIANPFILARADELTADLLNRPNQWVYRSLFLTRDLSNVSGQCHVRSGGSPANLVSMSQHTAPALQNMFGHRPYFDFYVYQTEPDFPENVQLNLLYTLNGSPVRMTADEVDIWTSSVQRRVTFMVFPCMVAALDTHMIHRAYFTDVGPPGCDVQMEISCFCSWDPMSSVASTSMLLEPSYDLEGNIPAEAPPTNYRSFGYDHWRCYYMH
jgi:hypothetical protein